MCYYNIMTSHTTKKRSYKKRTSKKTTHKGGDIQMFGYNCAKINDNDEVKVEEEESPEVEGEESPEVEEEESPEVEEEESPEVEEDEEEDDIIFGSGKKGRKSKKSTKKGRKSSNKKRKTVKKKGKSAWTTFVTELYRKNKQKNPVYMFKTALKDAAKIYKK